MILMFAYLECFKVHLLLMHIDGEEHQVASLDAVALQDFKLGLPVEIVNTDTIVFVLLGRDHIFSLLLVKVIFALVVPLVNLMQRVDRLLKALVARFLRQYGCL